MAPYPDRLAVKQRNRAADTEHCCRAGDKGQIDDFVADIS